MAEKCYTNPVQSKNTSNTIEPNEQTQADDRSPSSKEQFKQHRQQRRRQRRLKNDLIFNPRISPEFRLFSLSILLEIFQTAGIANMYDGVKIRESLVHVLSNVQNVPISPCCFVTFCKQLQRNEQRIIKHAYTAIVLVTVRVCLIKLPKPNKRPDNEQLNEQKNKPKPSKKDG